MTDGDALLHWTAKSQIDKRRWFTKLGYEPHDGQWAFHRSPQRFRVMPCGWGWGKTRAAAQDYEPLLLMPRVIGWIVAPSYVLGEKPFRYFWHDLMGVFGRDFFAEGTKYLPDAGKMRIVFPEHTGGSILEVKTEHHPEGLEGENVDFALFEEAGQLKRRTWERVYGRLRMGGEAAFLFTPEGFGYTHELYLRGPDPDFPDWWSQRGPSSDNPYLDPDFVKDARRDLTPEAYEAKILGRFRTSVGHVLPDFDEVYNTGEFEMEPSLPVYSAIDYGYTNPFVWLWVQFMPSGQVRVCREYYQANVTTDDHGRWMKDRMKLPAYDRFKFAKPIDDPAGADERATLKKLGFHCIPVTREVLAGIEALRQSLRPIPIDSTHSVPGLLVHRSCKMTIRDLTEWRFPERKEEFEVKELPMKVNDHAPEALSRLLCWMYQKRRMKDFYPSVGGRSVMSIRNEKGRRYRDEESW